LVMTGGIGEQIYLRLGEFHPLGGAQRLAH
jgi:hypothetical protein